MKTASGLFAVLAICAGLQGCAGVGAPAPGSDAALCAQARAERMRGDQNWTLTVDRITDRHTAWYCVNYEMANDMGFIQGGP
jgi:alkylation response protein AidB-like acyl-CoA dehydrogenase